MLVNPSTSTVLSLRIAFHKADKEMMRVAFRRCHNFIHGNEGMPKDAAFWQFLFSDFLQDP